MAAGDYDSSAAAALVGPQGTVSNESANETAAALSAAETIVSGESAGEAAADGGAQGAAAAAGQFGRTVQPTAYAGTLSSLSLLGLLLLCFRPPVACSELCLQ